MKESSRVALVRCLEYQPDLVDAAVHRGLELLGGAGRFASAGEKILLKPNILVGAAPDNAISPHPQVFAAVARAFRETGANLSYGDSPGVGNPLANAKRAGLAAVAEEMGIPFADFTTARSMPFPQGHLINKFEIAEGVASSDGLISLSKFKTHALTRITGAIKNQFGCIPGVRKAEYHSVMPNADLFSQMLVDLNLLLKPRLYIMDGIIAMQGNGPRSGTPRPMQVLLFSTDPVALDATVCRMIDLDPKMVLPLVHGEAFGLGSARDIEYLGEPLESFIQPDFDVNRSPEPTTTRQELPLDRPDAPLRLPAPGDRPDPVHALRPVRGYLPGQAQGTGLGQQRAHRHPHLQLRPLHPLLLLPGDLPIQSYLGQAIADREDRPRLVMFSLY